jgi:predicted nucleic acid-binding protein
MQVHDVMPSTRITVRNVDPELSLQLRAISSGRAQENRRVLAEFLDEPFTTVSEVTATTVRYYARTFASLRRAGTPIPVNDVWIAAATMECNGHLLTFDRDYCRIVDLDHTLLEAA